MLTFAANSKVLPDRRILGKKWNSIYPKKFIGGRNFCPCCSYTLLAHIRLDTIYWHCRHCFQEMPLMAGRRKVLPLMDYETLFQQLLISKRQKEEDDRAASVFGRLSTPSFMS